MKKETESKKTEVILKIKPDFTKYWNVNRLFSYDGISFYLVIGGRGIGKTTGLNIHNILDFKKKGNEFLYVRRYMEELKKTKSMFDPLVNKIKTQGLSRGLMQWQVDNTRLGYGAALTGQQMLKSGVDFTKVNTMVYDEAILPRGGNYRYLENEIEMFFELVSTVFRDRKGYRVFILGNNADLFNPYFEYFNIPKFERSYMDVDRGLYCELAKNSAALLESEAQTPLYKLTQGTQYFEYHYNNKVLSTENTRIGPKPLNTTLICRIVINGLTLNLYRYRISGMFVELRDKPIEDRYTYKILDNNEPNYHFIKEFKDSDISRFVNMAYYTDNTLFESDKAHAIFKIFLETI